MGQPCKVANPARGQLNRGKYMFPCPRSHLRIGLMRACDCLKTFRVIDVHADIRSMMFGDRSVTVG